MTTFNASVSYGDFSGTFSADSAHNSIYDYINGLEKLNQGEKLFGIRSNISESDIRTESVSVTFIVADIGNSKDIPSYLKAHKGSLTLKEISVDVSVIDFLSYFKQISFTLSPVKEMSGIEYTPN
jgi:hypothetical protein